MFEKLELTRRNFQSLGESAFSLIAHLAIGYAVIRTTTGSAASREAPRSETTVVFLKPPESPPPAPPLSSSSPPGILAKVAPPLGFQTIVPLATIPLDIPPVDLSERFNAADFSGRGVEGGTAEGVRSQANPAAGTGAVGEARAFIRSQVDEPVEVVSIPTPRYPPALRLAGITGRLVVQYVVDTIGDPEPRSWRVLRSTSAAFEDAAREAIMQARFRPARIKGRPVRQLVQQAIAFTLSSGGP